MRETALAVILVILVIALAALGLYAAGPSGPTSSTMSGPPPGLELRVAYNANAGTLKAGQSLNVQVSLFNTLPATNTVPTARDWPFEGVPVDLWNLCYGDTPAYAVVLKGNYSLQDLQTLAPTTGGGITCSELASINHVAFQPNSSRANLTRSGMPPPPFPFMPGPYQLSVNFTTSGYWDLANQLRVNGVNPAILGDQNHLGPQATPFVPGVYTLAVSDEWGQVDVFHFTVEG